MWSPGARRGRADAKLGWTGAATCLVCCATGQCGGGSGERRGSGSVDTAEVAADRTQRWWAESRQRCHAPCPAPPLFAYIMSGSRKRNRTALLSTSILLSAFVVRWATKRLAGLKKKK